MIAPKFREKEQVNAKLTPPGGGVPLFRVRVEIIETRRVYGRVEYKITPVSGKGSAWVQEQTLDRN